MKSEMWKKWNFQIMNTNVCGVMAMTKAFLPLLKKSSNTSNGANVINISSSLGSIELTVAPFTCTSYRFFFEVFKLENVLLSIF